MGALASLWVIAFFWEQLLCCPDPCRRKDLISQGVPQAGGRCLARGQSAAARWFLTQALFRLSGKVRGPSGPHSCLPGAPGLLFPSRRSSGVRGSGDGRPAAAAGRPAAPALGAQQRVWLPAAEPKRCANLPDARQLPVLPVLKAERGLHWTWPLCGREVGRWKCSR